MDERDAQDTLTVDPMVQQACPEASSTAVGDALGSSASGDAVVIGTHFEAGDAARVDGDQHRAVPA